jgi:hypothetical protein
VVGKGPSAALAVSVVASVISECKRSRATLEGTIGKIAERLFDLFGGQITTTLSAVSIDPKTATADVYACGVTGWFVVDIGGPQYLPLRGSTLGSSVTPRYGHKRLVLGPGASLFAFTDGCLEGSRAIKGLIDRLRKLPAGAVELGELHRQVIEAGANHVLYDDKTMIALRRAAVKAVDVA